MVEIEFGFDPMVYITQHPAQTLAPSVCLSLPRSLLCFKNCKIKNLQLLSFDFSKRLSMSFDSHQNPPPMEEEEISKKAAAKKVVDDPLASYYGDVPLEDLQSIGNLKLELKEQEVLVRGRAQTICAVSKKMAFLVVREKGCTVQCVLSVALELVGPQMVNFAKGLSKESVVDIHGVVSVPQRSH